MFILNLKCGFGFVDLVWLVFFMKGYTWFLLGRKLIERGKFLEQKEI